jgi:arylsulfatase
MNRPQTGAWLLAGGTIAIGCTLILSAACGLWPNERSSPEASSRANVLLIVVDTLRADHLSLYGYGRDTSPRIDELAATSLVFTNAFTVMSHTLPAHVSLMTGLHPATHQVLSNDRSYSGKERLLAERLGDAGYATAAFVSGVPLRQSSGLARGFELYADTVNAHGQMEGKVDGERTTRKALDWLESRAGEPFFLFVHYFDTHPPYTSPPGGPTFAVDAVLRSHMQKIGASGLSVKEVSTNVPRLDGEALNLAQAINTYDNEIRRVDGLIGDLLAGLERTGLADETLLIITSDHGEGLGQHGYFSHGARLYEEQIHIPLILRPSRDMKIDPGSVESTVSLLDIAPTILEAAGLAEDDSMHGGSLGSASRRSASHGGRWLLAQRRYFPERVRRARRRRFTPQSTLHAIRGDGDLKYLRAGDGSEELYDLSHDPRERRNIAGERPESVEPMRNLMDALLQRVSRGDPGRGAGRGRAAPQEAEDAGLRSLSCAAQMLAPRRLAALAGVKKAVQEGVKKSGTATSGHS